MASKKYWLKRTRLPVAGIIFLTFLLSLAAIQACGGGSDDAEEPTATPSSAKTEAMGGAVGYASETEAG